MITINAAPKDPVINCLDELMHEKLSYRKIRKQIASPIIVPDRFFLAMEYANEDIMDIEESAHKVKKISTENELSLEFYENYFNLRLDVHLERQTNIIDFCQMLITVLLAFSAFVLIGIGPNIKTFLASITSITAIFMLFYKAFYNYNFSHETRIYKYCIIILKRAQELTIR